MANQISTQVSITNVGDNGRNVLSTNSTTNTTSSYGYLVGTTQVASATATAINVSSLTDVLLFTAVNDNSIYTASTIQITGSSGNIGSILIPGAQAVFPWSGSIGSLSAKVVSGWPVGTATPTSGSLNWTAQGLN